MNQTATLLQDINNEIVLAGSREMLMYQIIKENPEAFPFEVVQNAASRLKGINRTRAWHKKKYKHKGTDHWSQEDITFLMANYGKMKTRSIANIISRTPIACRGKYYREATPEQLKWLFDNGRYAGRVNNFKKNL